MCSYFSAGSHKYAEQSVSEPYGGARAALLAFYGAVEPLRGSRCYRGETSRVTEQTCVCVQLCLCMFLMCVRLGVYGDVMVQVQIKGSC